MVYFERRLNDRFYWDFLVQYHVPDPVEPEKKWTCWTIITQATVHRAELNPRVSGMQTWAKSMSRETGYNLEIKAYGVKGIFDHLKQSNPGFFENGECFPIWAYPFL